MNEFRNTIQSNSTIKSQSNITLRRDILFSAQFNVWRRTMPQQTSVTENTEEINTAGVEWMPDIFDAALVSEKMPINQLRSCHLTSKQTQILATLVPDEIININNLGKKETTTFVGVLLFADVSGFTALCEKYNNTGKGGTYRLTATLNGYIGAMVEVIYSHGGDVLKFSGDAFLAIWKVKRDEFMFLVIHNAISCALYIQHTLGAFETDVKVFLKVKLAISAGNMTFAVIGDGKSRHYIVCGTPINDVKLAEQMCVSGDVILAPSAWGHCSATNYEYSYKDLHHVKVTRIIYNPGLSKRKVVHQLHDKVNVTLDPKKKMLTSDQATHISKEIENNDEVEEQMSLSVRPSVKESSRRKLGLVLRPFVIPPVVQQVDADQPLEFLTEMRQVTTMFVNLIPMKVPTKALILMVDEAYITICRLVRSAMGCVNKVSLFDKDVMFLVIFGLRGYNHVSESQSGLKCAVSVFKAISALEGVSCVSIGVTTGMVYCGVVGHPLRREYTVIGGSVNKAARIMCAYPGKVTCEQNTFLHSKLPAKFFVIQEIKELKGIGNAGPIYEYIEYKRNNLERGPNCGIFPILGREDPVQMFHNLLQPSSRYSGMLIQGEARVGKSRLLDELMKQAKPLGFTSVLVSLNPIHLAVPYTAVNHMFKQILGLRESATARDKEECLITILGNLVPQDELCYLNDIMQVKFPHSARYLDQNYEERREVAQHVFQCVLGLNNKRLIIAVDDAQYIDQDSCKLLLNAINDNSILLVMTMYHGRQTFQMTDIEEILSSNKMSKVYLSGLKEHCLAPLACQILNVRAIAPEVES